MAQKVLIMGESGTGKSTSMRNCDPATTAIVNPVGKSLPFKGKFEMLNSVTDARKITKYMKDQVAAGKKLIVVDDFQYILAVPYMNRIKETGWDKYNDFGANYFEIIDVCKDLPDDVIVVYLTHLETLDNGLTTVKLIGKLLREKITIEGLFTVVLRSGCAEAKYYFYTQNSGKDTVKSPIGMFPTYAIDNDLAYVVDKVRNYYEIGEYKTDDEIKQADQKVAADVEKPEGKGRRARTASKATPPTTNETATESSGRSARKTHDEVIAENQQKIDSYQNQVDAEIDKAAGDREGIPFDEAVAATADIPQPELETPPRRTRKERQTAEQAESVPDDTTNTDAETVVLDEDAYFYIPADDNYVMKHKGETVDLIVGGKEVARAITKEEFGEGIKRLAQLGAPAGDNSLEGNMNLPESGRRTRRNQAAQTTQEAAATAEPEQAGTGARTTRRARRTR